LKPYDTTNCTVLDAGDNVVLSAGSHEVNVVVDNGNNIKETSKTNNDYPRRLFVRSGLPGPDLVVQSRGIISKNNENPLIAYENVPFEYVLKLSNAGEKLNAGIDEINMTFYIDGQSYESRTVETLYLTQSILGDHLQIEEFTLSAGKHTIKVNIDSENAVDEKNEENNELTEEILVNPGPPKSINNHSSSSSVPDLTIEFYDVVQYITVTKKNEHILYIPDNRSDIYEDTRLDVSVEISNLGGQLSRNIDNIFIRYSIDGEIINTQSFGKSNSVYPINPERIYMFDGGMLPSGEHTLKFTIDPDNKILESDESNNEFTKVVQVKPLPGSVANSTAELNKPIEHKIAGNVPNSNAQILQQVILTPSIKCRFDSQCPDGNVCLPGKFLPRLFGKARCCPYGSTFENGDCVLYIKNTSKDNTVAETPDAVLDQAIIIQNAAGFLTFPLYPVDDFKITSGWCRSDCPDNPHKGIDYVPFNKSKEYEVYAASSGVVTRVVNDSYDNLLNGGSLSDCISSDSTAAYGNRIHVAYENPDTDTTYEVVYAHFKKGSIRFSNGDKVERGDILGIMGNTGCSTASHLHFEVRVNNSASKKIDPYDIYDGPSDYPYVSNRYDEPCGSDHLWTTCPPTFINNTSD
jgi:murein DD-endopeptidase MepM/ murein hydrolase activator NlpD